MNIKIYDLVNSQINKNILSAFQRTIGGIQDEPHRNARNYDGIEKLEGFLAFHVVYHEESQRILAFSGLQQRHFPNTIARALSRTWYCPEIRQRHLKPVRSSTYATHDMLPLQVEIAKSLGKSAVFISMEFLRRRKALDELVRYVGSDWQLLPEMHLTCPDIDSKNCWQNTAAFFLEKNFSFPLPSMPVDEWAKNWSCSTTKQNSNNI